MTHDPYETTLTQTRAAKLLGVSRQALIKRLENRTLPDLTLGSLLRLATERGCNVVEVKRHALELRRAAVRAPDDAEDEAEIAAVNRFVDGARSLRRSAIARLRRLDARGWPLRRVPRLAAWVSILDFGEHVIDWIEGFVEPLSDRAGVDPDDLEVEVSRARNWIRSQSDPWLGLGAPMPRWRRPAPHGVAAQKWDATRRTRKRRRGAKA